MKSLKGLFPALVTPLCADGSVNLGSLRALVRMNLDKGVAGFYVGGSTSECFLLTAEERKKILEAVVSETAGAAAVIAHIGSIGTDLSIELGRHAEKTGVDAVSSVPPFYYKFSPEEIRAYYRDITDAVNKPMIIYNFPALSGVTLTAEAVAEYAKDERIIGVKHTSMDLYQLERMKKTVPGLTVYSGHDEVYLGGLVLGADGAIGSTYNFMAERFTEISRLFAEGKIGEAQKKQGEANDIISLLLRIGSLQATKYILTRMGVDCGECRKPFSPLKEADKKTLDALVERL